MTSDSRHSIKSSDDPYSVPGAFPDPADVDQSALQTLSQAVYARRDEYTKPQKIRIKIGSWNVGNHDCAKDIAAWFADGKGIDEHFSRLELDAKKDLEQVKKNDSIRDDGMETIDHQEARVASLPGEPTVPLGDEGAEPAGDEIGLYVIGLQEIVDVASPTEALRPYTDPAPAKKYKEAVHESLPEGYTLVAEQQLIGLLLLVFASPSIAKDVKSATTTSVGTGLMGYMGNKGAVTAHVILGETTRLVFVNCHLAAGAEKAAVDRRNWDANQITTRTRFDKVQDPSGLPTSGESIGDEDFAFWFGDLNYRLESIPGEDVRRLLTLHTQNEYDLRKAEERKRLEEEAKEQPVDAKTESDSASVSVSINSEDTGKSTTSKFSEWQEDHYEVPSDLDPTSLQMTLSSLLPHDELAQQIKLRKGFSEGWREGPIRFLPTYKYDAGSVAVFDSSDKKRSPSWCDRILYRTRTGYMEYKKRIMDEEAARKKDEEMKAHGIEEDENVIFDYNPEEDGEDMFEHTDMQLNKVMTRDGSADEILLEYYTSHQRVLSSDHKPIDAIFSLIYQGVDPTLKAKVHGEVTRVLDRNENEGRPTVTIVVENASKDDDNDIPAHENVDGILNFGGIRFAKSKHRHITVANTGQVAATINLVDRPVADLGAEGPTPCWMGAQFDREPDTVKDKKSKGKGEGPAYTLEPGDLCNIEFVARVDSTEMAKDLDDGIMKLDDVLILRVRNGRDHFLPVQGRWVGSSFERSIEALKRLPEESVRKLQQQKPDGSKAAGSKAAGFFSFRKSEG